MPGVFNNGGLMNTVNERNIYQRINEVRKEVGYLQKDKKVGESGGYMAITHDYVTESIRDHLIKHGIMLIPSVRDDYKTVLTGTQTSKGVPFIRVEASYSVWFVNIDRPEDKIAMIVYAHAIDQGDKAPGKALSYATKYAMLKAFNIATGEEEEERQTQRVEPEVPDIDEAFYSELKVAAQFGIEAYRNAWTKGTPAQRKSCAQFHDGLKKLAASNEPPKMPDDRFVTGPDSPPEGTKKKGPKADKEEMDDRAKGRS